MRLLPVLVFVTAVGACNTPPPVETSGTATSDTATPPVATTTEAGQAAPDVAQAGELVSPGATSFAPEPPSTAPARRAQTRTGSTAAPVPAPSVTPEPRSIERSAAPVAPAAAPAAPAVPVFREVVLPAGTALDVELTTTIESASSKVEDTVRARLKTAVTRDGRTVIPAGAELVGTVTEAEQAGRVRGRSRIAFRFTSLRAGGERHDIQTETIAREGDTTKREDATKVGVGAGVGAAIGGILGGGSGAAKGAAIGGAAGTGAVLATRGREVRLGAGDAVEAHLSAPLAVQVPR
jgi:hypothetical protein